jgi:hypothetical protein
MLVLSMGYLIIIGVIIGIFILGGVITIWNNSDPHNEWSLFIIGGLLFLITAILIWFVVLQG